MRTDSVGLFWQDMPLSKKRGERVLGPMPPIPETDWRAPRDFPNLSAAPIIGLDTETYDPQLLTKGPGWARRAASAVKRSKGVPEYLHALGALVGVSVAVPGRAWYFPIRHTIEHGTNLDPDNVLSWLRDALAGTQPKVGTNLIYDVGWLQEEGVQVNGPLLDISYAEALLTETGKLSLDAMAAKYLGTGKETNLLYRWCYDWYGGKEHDQRENIWRAPPSLVGPYAEADALLPLRILDCQIPVLRERGLLDLFDMECRLTRLLLAMRFRGVRVDLAQAQLVDDKLTKRIDDAQQRLNDITGSEVNVNAGASIAVAFDKVGLSYPLTPKSGQPSFTRGFLKSIEHPIPRTIMEIRRCMKLRDTFVRSYIMEAHVGGRVHGQFHPIRNEGYGTRSGRFSSSNPNLQNIPSRDAELAPLVRSIFIPEEDATWMRFDYSQIEYRKLLHFAVGEGAEEARQRYRDDPDIDYHAAVQDELHRRTGRRIERKPTKNINFGMIYGMGKDKLGRELSLTKQEAAALFRDYHAAVPYVKETMDATMEEAQKLGYIQTVLGRRSYFETWVPSGYMNEGVPLPYDAALRKHGSHIERAGLHKALNRRLQGSAADLIKVALLKCWESGLFAEDRLPLLTVHDENDFSAKDPLDPVWAEIRHVMETALELRVPIRADMEAGANWGSLKKLLVSRRAL